MNSQSQSPPPYEPWMSIKDESVTKPAQPPPSFFSGKQEFDSRLNATADSAERAQHWVNAYPLWPPSSGDDHGVPETPFWWGVEFQGSVERVTTSSTHNATHGHQRHGLSSLFGTRYHHFDNDQQNQPSPQSTEHHRNNSNSKASGRTQWEIKTKRGAPDACLVHCRPTYSALRSAQDARQLNVRKGQENTTLQILSYYEIAIDAAAVRDNEASIAIGFVAMPYPLWRLPGWNRASIGVHGDDGRRFVNDPLGGRKFVAPFRPGDVVGLGWRLSPSSIADGRPKYVQVFFTRNGKIQGSWDLHESLDASTDQPGGVVGLQGDYDLYPAIGVCGECRCIVNLHPEHWMWKPEPADFYY